MSKKYTVIVSKRATQMIVTHAAFLAKVNADAAEKWVDVFEEAANSLEQMSYRCPWFNVEYIPLNKYRYLMFARHYLMIYQIRDDTVYIDYIVDCRQDYGWLLH